MADMASKQNLVSFVNRDLGEICGLKWDGDYEGKVSLKVKVWLESEFLESRWGTGPTL